jgi:hypothetical protein
MKLIWNIEPLVSRATSVVSYYMTDELKRHRDDERNDGLKDISNGMLCLYQCLFPHKSRYLKWRVGSFDRLIK